MSSMTSMTSPKKGKTAVCGSPTFFAGWHVTFIYSNCMRKCEQIQISGQVEEQETHRNRNRKRIETVPSLGTPVFSRTKADCDNFELFKANTK